MVPWIHNGKYIQGGDGVRVYRDGEAAEGLEEVPEDGGDVDLLGKTLGPVGTRRNRPVKKGWVRSGSHFEKSKAHPVPPRFIYKRVRSGSFNFGPGPARAHPYIQHYVCEVPYKKIL